MLPSPLIYIYIYIFFFFFLKKVHRDRPIKLIWPWNFTQKTKKPNPAQLKNPFKKTKAQPKRTDFYFREIIYYIYKQKQIHN